MSKLAAEVENRFELVSELAKLAGHIALQGQQGELEIKQKTSGVRDIVTKYDPLVERFVVNRFLQVFPNDSIRSEEQDREINGNSGFAVVQDPIDNTLGYSLGSPQFAAPSIGIHYDGKPVAGVIHFPALDLTYTAIAGKGAFCNGKPAKPLQYTELSETGLFFNYPYLKTPGDVDEHILPLYETLAGKAAYIWTPSCATLTICQLAAGQGVALALQTNLSPYDLGAADLILREAGGISSEIDWSKPRQPHLAAANKALYAQLLEAINPRLRNKWSF